MWIKHCLGCLDKTLGEERTIVLKHKENKHERILRLENGSVTIMHNPTLLKWHYEMQLDETKFDSSINICFCKLLKAYTVVSANE